MIVKRFIKLNVTTFRYRSVLEQEFIILKVEETWYYTCEVDQDEAN